MKQACLKRMARTSEVCNVVSGYFPAPDCFMQQRPFNHPEASGSGRRNEEEKNGINIFTADGKWHGRP